MFAANKAMHPTLQSLRSLRSGDGRSLGCLACILEGEI